MKRWNENPLAFISAMVALYLSASFSKSGSVSKSEATVNCCFSFWSSGITTLAARIFIAASTRAIVSGEGALLLLAVELQELIDERRQNATEAGLVGGTGWRPK